MQTLYGRVAVRSCGFRWGWCRNSTLLRRELGASVVVNYASDKAGSRACCR